MIQKSRLQTIDHLACQNEKNSLKTFKSLKKRGLGRPRRRPLMNDNGKFKKTTFLILGGESCFYLTGKTNISSRRLPLSARKCSHPV